MSATHHRMPKPRPDRPPEPEWLAGVPRYPTKHIAVFIYGLTGGGAQRRTVTLANAFAACGHQVDLVLVRGEGVLEPQLAPRVRVVALDRTDRLLGRAIRASRTRGVQTFASIPALARYLRRQQPDLLLSAASHVNLVAVAGWRLARLPIALVLRASNHPTGNLANFPPAQRLVRAWMRWLTRRFYPRADLVVTVSHGVAEELARLTGIPRERIVTIYNPVTTPALADHMAEPLDHPWLAASDAPLVLAAGTFKIQKDFRTLVDAFARLRRERRVRLAILGDGPLRPAIAQRVRELGLEEEVLLPGFILNPLPWMRRASLFVLSSMWEGLPGVLIEAMACGCPVVATDCPSGPREILEEGRYGPLVPVGDARALAAAMAAQLDRPTPADLLRARAAAFDLPRAVARYLELFEACIHARVPRRLARIPPWPLKVPLTYTSEDGLDYVLGRLGLARVDLFRPFAGNAEHRQLMARMMERLGVDVGRAVELAWAQLREADARCAACEAVRACRQWLRQPTAEPPDFCPNLPLFRHLAAPAAVR